MGARRPIDTAEVGLILFRRELELAPGGGCGPIINCRAELNLAIHNAIINDVNQPASATLFLEALADWRHPLAIEQLVIPEALGHGDFDFSR